MFTSCIHENAFSIRFVCIGKVSEANILLNSLHNGNLSACLDNIFLTLLTTSICIYIVFSYMKISISISVICLCNTILRSSYDVIIWQLFQKKKTFMQGKYLKLIPYLNTKLLLYQSIFIVKCFCLYKVSYWGTSEEPLAIPLTSLCFSKHRHEIVSQ